MSPLCSMLTLLVLLIVDLPIHRYDLLHNAHLNLEGLDELFKVAQVQMESTPTIFRKKRNPSINAISSTTVFFFFLFFLFLFLFFLFLF